MGAIKDFIEHHDRDFNAAAFLDAAHRRVPHWRALSASDEQELYDGGYNRVTDTCIPEGKAMRKVEKPLIALSQECDRNNVLDG